VKSYSHLIFLFALSISQIGIAQTTSSTLEAPARILTQSVLLDKCLSDPKNIYSQERDICFVQESERKDKEIEGIIERQWQRIFSADNDVGASEDLKADQAAGLHASQTDWLVYRESWCRHVADMVVGTGRPSAYVQCKLEFAKKRITELIELDY